MPELVTLGGLVAAALSTAGEATLKGAVGEAVKDTYQALKVRVSHWASHDVEALEKMPTSMSRQAVIAEIIDAQPKEDQEHLRALAEKLVAGLKRDALAAGLDIGRVTALEAHLGNTNAINVVIGKVGTALGEANTVTGIFTRRD